MIGVAVVNICEVVNILHVDDEHISARVMDCSCLEECDVVEGRSIFPGDV